MKSEELLFSNLQKNAGYRVVLNSIPDVRGDSVVER